MTTKTLMTAEEFESICDRLGPCELVRGEVEPLSPGGYAHSHISTNVTLLLGNWAKESKLGRVLSNEAGHIVTRDPDTVRGADMAYLSYRRLPAGTKITGFVDIPPDLVVEVLGQDESWGRMLDKISDYFGMGVDRVWVLTPNTRRLHIFRADTDPVVLEVGDMVSDESILPGFSTKLDAFFEE